MLYFHIHLYLSSLLFVISYLTLLWYILFFSFFCPPDWFLLFYHYYYYIYLYIIAHFHFLFLHAAQNFIQKNSLAKSQAIYISYSAKFWCVQPPAMQDNKSTPIRCVVYHQFMIWLYCASMFIGYVCKFVDAIFYAV